MKYVFVLMTHLLSSSVSGQEAITIGEKYIFHSKVLNEEREVWIKLPAGYHADESKKYPVVYLLDGRNNFIYTTGLLRQLENRSVPKSILVGIINTNRDRDLTPPIAGEKQSDTNEGGANKFIEMLEKDMFPYIQEQYRVKEFKTLIGHSIGGLFAVYSLASKPDLFNAYLAISPSLWWDDQNTVKYFEKRLEETPEMKGMLYLTMADERGNMLGGLMKLIGVLESRSPENLRWDYQIFPNENHGTIPVVSEIAGMNFFYQDWYLPSPIFKDYGLEAIQMRKERIKKEFGEDWDLENSFYADYLFRLNLLGLVDEQLELSLNLIKSGKNAVDFHEAAARSFLQLKDTTKAIHHYKEAFKLNPGYEDVGEMLDLLGVKKNDLLGKTALMDKEKIRYVGKYSDSENLCSISLIDGSVHMDYQEQYSNISSELEYMGQNTFYIPNGYYQIKFHFIDDPKQASHIIIIGTDGVIQKLVRIE
jgi:hypothetical protein